MIRTKQANDDNGDLERHEAKDDRVPALEDETLEIHVRTLAPGKYGARVAHLGNCSLDERGEKAATIELILDTKPFAEAEIVTPLRVDLAVEIEVAPLEGEVARGYEEDKTQPKEEGVHGEE